MKTEIEISKAPSPQLLLPDHRPSGVWVCSVCRLVFMDRDSADRCCVCSYCGKPLETPRSFSHDECRDEARELQEAKVTAAAEKVEAFDGWVYCDGYGNEGYCESIDELIDELEDNVDPEDWPEYVFTCTKVPFPVVDISDITERIADQSYEDAVDHLHGVDELKAAIEEFNQANKGIVSYVPNYKLAVRVPKGVTV